MKTSLKLVLSLTAALLAAPFASAQVTLHDFTAFESPNTFFLSDWELTGDAGGTTSPRATFSQGAGFYNFVGGLNDDASSAIHFFAAPLNITGLSLLEVSAMTLQGNTAPSFTVSLFDSLGESATATFETSAFANPGFLTLHQELTFSGAFNSMDVAGFSLSGNVLGGTQTLNLAVNHLAIVPVPEPATYGAAAALLLLGVVAVRRRRRSAA
jgi:MYXO-CTERM domain-containing protein